MRVRDVAAWLTVFVLVACLALVAPPAALEAQAPNFRQPIACDNSIVVSGATAVTTELVALTAGEHVMVCGVALSAAGTTTAKLVRGTGTACGTGTADVTGAFALAATTVVDYGGGVGTIARLPAGEALCWTNSGAVQVSGIVTYAKF